MDTLQNAEKCRIAETGVVESEEKPAENFPQVIVRKYPEMNGKSLECCTKAKAQSRSKGSRSIKGTDSEHNDKVIATIQTEKDVVKRILLDAIRVMPPCFRTVQKETAKDPCLRKIFQISKAWLTKCAKWYWMSAVQKQGRIPFSNKRMLSVPGKSCNSMNAETASSEATTQRTSRNKKDEITSQATRVLVGYR